MENRRVGRTDHGIHAMDTVLAYADRKTTVGEAIAGTDTPLIITTKPAVSTVAVGGKTAEHLDQSVAAAAKGPLPDDVLKRLDEIAAMVPARPYEEPMILPFGKDYFGPGIANMGAAVQVGKLKLQET
ncbi:MAG: hypothetical protein AAGD07_10720 [Planctomycetota bacterium]